MSVLDDLEKAKKLLNNVTNNIEIVLANSLNRLLTGVDNDVFFAVEGRSTLDKGTISFLENVRYDLHVKNSKDEHRVIPMGMFTEDEFKNFIKGFKFLDKGVIKELKKVNSDLIFLNQKIFNVRRSNDTELELLKGDNAFYYSKVVPEDQIKFSSNILPDALIEEFALIRPDIKPKKKVCGIPFKSNK